jgi:hypothetical protein
MGAEKQLNHTTIEFDVLRSAHVGVGVRPIVAIFFAGSLHFSYLASASNTT